MFKKDKEIIKMYIENIALIPNRNLKNLHL